MSQQRDLHSALKTDVIASAEGRGVQFKLVELQWSKDDIAYSVHANPTTFSSSGLQTAELLAHLGFKVGSCAFFPNGKCLANMVRPDFPLADFAGAFALAYPALREAERQLRECGFAIDQPDRFRSSGDGHTSPQSQQMKQFEDEHFIFIMSWIEGGGDRGWTFHYHPKHPPLSGEMRAAFSFLELREFEQCPYFDFEPCYWRFFSFEQRGDSFFGRNTEFVYGCFDKHSEKFSIGIENLLKVHGLLRPFDFEFLPQLKEPRFGVPRQLAPSPERPVVAEPPELRTFDFDVAVSFAGTERIHAEKLASLVRETGFNVFYDDFYPEQLWGKDLVVFFDEIYRKRSRYCVMFVSQEYADRMWTTHERVSAQARAIQEKGNEYILPIRVDDAELPGLPPTIGYLKLEDYGIDKIANILIAKLKA